ncbi:hypothetical protein KJ942_05585, partial [bacterium]|nr:hypothetical protein [bacterium]
KIKKEKTKELKDLQIKTTVSLILAGLVVWGSFPGLMNTVPAILKNMFNHFLLASIVQFWGAYDFYKAAISSLKHRLANMDTLVVIGTTVAYLYSSAVVFFPGFFESLNLDLSKYSIAGVSHIYGLWCFSNYCVDNNKNNIEYIKNKLNEFFNEQKKPKRDIKNMHVSVYKDSMSSATKSFSQRNKRMEALKKYVFQE